MQLNPTRSSMLVVFVCLCLSEIPPTTGQDYYHDGREYIQDCPVCSWGEEPSIPCGKTTKDILLGSPPKCITCLDGFYQRFNFSTGQCKNCTIPLDPNLEVKTKCGPRHNGTYECKYGYFKNHNSDCHDCCDKDYARTRQRIQKCRMYIRKECPKNPRRNRRRTTYTPTTHTSTTHTSTTHTTTTLKPTNPPAKSPVVDAKLIYAILGVVSLIAAILAMKCCFRKRRCKTSCPSGEPDEIPEPNETSSDQDTLVQIDERKPKESNGYQMNPKESNETSREKENLVNKDEKMKSGSTSGYQMNPKESNETSCDKENLVRKDETMHIRNENKMVLRMSEDLEEKDVKKIKGLYKGAIGEEALNEADALDLLHLLKASSKGKDMIGFCEIFETIGRNDLSTKYGSLWAV